MSDLEIPNFGALLGPYIVQVGPELRPRFLALLERGAAARYRSWAEMLPEHAEGLLACAAREDEISDRVESVFPVAEADLPVLQAPLQGAIDTYYEVFAPYSPLDQLRLQADAERQGANAWRSIGANITDERVIEQLAACSALEETSADWLDGLLVDAN